MVFDGYVCFFFFCWMFDLVFWFGVGVVGRVGYEFWLCCYCYVFDYVVGFLCCFVVVGCGLEFYVCWWYYFVGVVLYFIGMC